MTRTQVLQEIRRMRFEEANGGWQESQLSQEKAARLPGVRERTFRRYVDRCEDEGLDGLVRLVQASARRAPEVVRAEAPYRERYDGWNVKHSFYRHRHEHRPSDCAVSFFCQLSVRSAPRASLRPYAGRGRADGRPPEQKGISGRCAAGVASGRLGMESAASTVSCRKPHGFPCTNAEQEKFWTPLKKF